MVKRNYRNESLGKSNTMSIPMVLGALVLSGISIAAFILVLTKKCASPTPAPASSPAPAPNGAMGKFSKQDAWEKTCNWIEDINDPPTILQRARLVCGFVPGCVLEEDHIEHVIDNMTMACHMGTSWNDFGNGLRQPPRGSEDDYTLASDLIEFLAP